MILMSLGAMGNGYATPSANSVSDMLDQKYGWTTDSEQSLHQSFIGTSIVVGLAIGAFTGGKIIPYGRRRAMILTSFVGIVGVGLTMIENFYILLLGRIIFGFTAGSQGVIVVRMINENVPENYFSTCLGIYSTAQNFAALLCLCSGLILPKDDDAQGLEDSEAWRYIFAFPFILYTSIILGFTFVIRHDSPKFYVSRGERDLAMTAIHKVYKTNGSQYLAEQIYGEIEAKMNGANGGGDAQKATLKEAYKTDERYVRASWVNFFAMIFHELTAINIIMSYSTTILEDILGDPAE